MRTVSFDHTASLSILLLQGRDDSRKAEVWEKHSILVTVSQGERRDSEFNVYLEETGDRIETCLGLLQPRIMKQGQ